MKVYSIFKSINGEVSGGTQGRICTFIRLSGCNLQSLGDGKGCSYCDTPYAFDKSTGKGMTLLQIVSKVKKQKCRYVTITGGEPLNQIDGLGNLLTILTNEGFIISVETNGSIPIPAWSTVYSWIVDWKLVSSGVQHLMNLDNFKNLLYTDFVKFIIGSKKDLKEAIVAMKQIKLVSSGPSFAFSPMAGKVLPNDLLIWMKEENLDDCILNVQLHKILKLTEDK